MSQSIGTDITYKASVDLDNNQFYIVAMSGSGTPGGVELPAAVEDGAAQTDVLLGILQNKPKMNEAAVVRVGGTSKLVASPMAIDALITSGSPAGIGMTAATDKDFVIGTVLETASTAGDIVEVLISRFKASI